MLILLRKNVTVQSQVRQSAIQKEIHILKKDKRMKTSYNNENRKTLKNEKFTKLQFSHWYGISNKFNGI